MWSVVKWGESVFSVDYAIAENLKAEKQNQFVNALADKQIEGMLTQSLLLLAGTQALELQ